MLWRLWLLGLLLQGCLLGNSRQFGKVSMDLASRELSYHQFAALQVDPEVVSVRIRSRFVLPFAPVYFAKLTHREVLEGMVFESVTFWERDAGRECWSQLGSGAMDVPEEVSTLFS